MLPFILKYSFFLFIFLKFVSSRHQSGFLCQQMGAGAKTTTRNTCIESLNWKSPSGPTSWGSGKFHVRAEEERLQESEWIKDTKRTWPTESTKSGLTLTHNNDKHGAFVGLHHVLCVYVGSLVSLWQWEQVCLSLLPAIGTPFLLLSCLIQPLYEDFYLVLLFLFCPVKMLCLGGLRFS